MRTVSSVFGGALALSGCIVERVEGVRPTANDFIIASPGLSVDLDLNNNGRIFSLASLSSQGIHLRSIDPSDTARPIPYRTDLADLGADHTAGVSALDFRNETQGAVCGQNGVSTFTLGSSPKYYPFNNRNVHCTSVAYGGAFLFVSVFEDEGTREADATVRAYPVIGANELDEANMKPVRLKGVRPNDISARPGYPEMVVLTRDREESGPGYFNVFPDTFPFTPSHEIPVPRSARGNTGTKIPMTADGSTALLRPFARGLLSIAIDSEKVTPLAEGKPGHIAYAEFKGDRIVALNPGERDVSAGTTRNGGIYVFGLDGKQTADSALSFYLTVPTPGVISGGSLVVGQGENLLGLPLPKTD